MILSPHLRCFLPLLLCFFIEFIREPHILEPKGVNLFDSLGEIMQYNKVPVPFLSMENLHKDNIN